MGDYPLARAFLGATIDGGCSIFRSLDLDESEEEVKATAGQVYGWVVHNANAATLYMKFYNATAADVSVGTTTPALTVPVSPVSEGQVFSIPMGIEFDTAITVAVTTGVADADTGAPAGSDFQINLFFK